MRGRRGAQGQDAGPERTPHGQRLSPLPRPLPEPCAGCAPGPVRAATVSTGRAPRLLEPQLSPPPGGLAGTRANILGAPPFPSPLTRAFGTSVCSSADVFVCICPVRGVSSRRGCTGSSWKSHRAVGACRHRERRHLPSRETPPPTPPNSCLPIRPTVTLLGAELAAKLISSVKISRPGWGWGWGWALAHLLCL